MVKNENVIWVGKEELFVEAKRNMLPAEIVMDIGCGIMPQRYIRPVTHICVEPFEQYIEVLKQKIQNGADRSYVIYKGLWDDAIKNFPEKSVDTVILTDVIEHIDKDHALVLLKNTERLARKQIILFTPLGFIKQEHPDGKDAWGLDGGKWQEHKSGWLPEDFDSTWKIIASKEFHETNNIGVRHEKPFGALWAIKTLDASSHNPKREEIIRIMSEIIDLNNQRVITWVGTMVRTILKIKNILSFIIDKSPIRYVFK